MQVTKRNIFFSFIFVIIIYLLFSLQLPYYVYKPGHVDELAHMIEMDSETPEVEGEFHLVTVSGAQATPIEYMIALFSDHQEVVPLEEARPEGMTDEEYMNYQLHLMENSHNASIAVSYQAANKKVEIERVGLYVVDVVDGMPAENVLEVGDKIVDVDDLTELSAPAFVDFIQEMEVGDTITLHIERDGAERTETVDVVPFPGNEGKNGIGIQLVTIQTVKTDPPVRIKSGKIGGPSAGLMFALEIYNRLTEEDITKGYTIAGTGELDMDGNVLRIGGVDKKVVAAHRENVDIFFVPKEDDHPESNYAVAKEAADRLNTSMEIVPVATFTEAIDYLAALEHKNDRVR